MENNTYNFRLFPIANDDDDDDDRNLLRPIFSSKIRPGSLPVIFLILSSMTVNDFWIVSYSDSSFPKIFIICLVIWQEIDELLQSSKGFKIKI